MIVEVDGERFEVPDDATPDEIDAISRQSAAPSAAPESPGLWAQALDTAKRVFGPPQGVRDLAAGMLPPTASPLGQLGNALTGGAYGEVAPAYGGLYQPPLPPVEQRPGETLRQALIRSAFNPENAERTLPLAMMASVPGGGPAPRRTLLQKSPAARQLESQGVKNLTVGQSVASPETSALAALEKATADNPLGSGAARDAAKETWRVSEIAKSRKPGETPLPGETSGALAESYARFGPEYEAFRKIPVDPDAVASLPQAASMPRRGVDARTAAGVKAEVENALTVIGFKPPAPPHAHGAAPAKPQGLVDPFGREIPAAPTPPPKATVGDLLKVRENIRTSGRAARTSQDFDRLRLLDEAEDVVTEAIESALPPKAVAALRDTDRRYATLMTVERAAPAGQTEFTPGQLLRSVEKSAGRRSFKQGTAKGQQSAEAARDVFSDMPFTGGRVAVLSALPGAKYWGSPLMRALNTAKGKRLLFEREFPAGLPPLLPPGAQGQLLLNALRRSPPGVRPALTPAEEDR